MQRLIVLLGCLIAPIALAQQDAAPSPLERARLHDWTLSFEARAWYAAPAGDLTLPGGSVGGDEIDLDLLNMDSPKLTPSGELRFQRGRVRIGLSGSAFSADRASTVATTQTLGAVAVWAGERAQLDFSHWSFETQALYEVFSYVDGSTSDGRDAVRVRGLLGGGVRVSALDLNFRVTPTDPGRTGSETLAVGYDGTFAELMIAGAFEIDLDENWFISVEGSGGWFGLDDRTSSSFSIQPTLAWHPNPHVGVEVGYRMLIHRMEDGSAPSQFEWSGSLAGLFGGLSVRF
ncbi:MAG: hypothetical protein Kow0022_02820 [Phycisphaerales bacterium]